LSPASTETLVFFAVCDLVCSTLKLVAGLGAIWELAWELCW
jgi:hypothetical protein